MQPKANDQTPLGLMRLEFCAGTEFTTPADAIEAGIKSTQDWLDALDQHRLENPSHAKPTTTEPLKAEISTRKQILDYLNAFDQARRYGFSTKEIADGIKKANNTVRDILNDLTEEGLLVAIEVIRSKHRREAKRYRLAGIDEVSK
jgi:hypothetical protein